MAEENNLLQSILDSDEGKRVSAVSDLLYSIENVNRVIGLTIRGLAQLPTYKDDYEAKRELYAAASVVDGITTQLEANWFSLHLHLERIEKTQKGAQPSSELKGPLLH